MNLSKILIEAHRIARIYRGAMAYRKALAHGLRQAWAFAKGVAELEAREAARQAVIMLDARDAPAGEMNVVLAELVKNWHLEPARARSEPVLRRAITETPRHDAEVVLS